ncbi:hypothetical protein ACIREO_24270 [Streptomyces sp. NPDC102441]|uniref:hypothetical protein n=1 Tax=Streptomyces sp. NPDC102441 TaxID=3366176 RepID=UPI0038162473
MKSRSGPEYGSDGRKFTHNMKNPRLRGQLAKTRGSTARGKDPFLEYRGGRNSFKIKRNSDGKHTFEDRYENHVRAGYAYRSCK